MLADPMIGDIIVRKVEMTFAEKRVMQGDVRSGPSGKKGRDMNRRATHGVMAGAKRHGARARASGVLKAAGAAMLVCVLSTPRAGLALDIIPLDPNDISWPPNVEIIPWPAPPLPELDNWIRTDALVYEPGQTALVSFGVTNVGTVDGSVGGNRSPVLGWCILDGDTRIDPYVGVYAAVIWQKTLAPGESYAYQHKWDLTDLEGNPLPPGNYDLVLTSYDTIPRDSPSVRITVVPEPTTLALVVPGVLALLPRRQRVAARYACGRSKNSRA